MIDPISLAVGAGILAAGALIGRITKKTGKPADVGPVCGCGHSLAEHERDSDRCRGEIRRKLYSKGGAEVGFHWVPCKCQRYVGPQPIESLWAPPILPSGEDR